MVVGLLLQAAQGWISEWTRDIDIGRYREESDKNSESTSYFLRSSGRIDHTQYYDITFFYFYFILNERQMVYA